MALAIAVVNGEDVFDFVVCSVFSLQVLVQDWAQVDFGLASHFGCRTHWLHEEGVAVADGILFDLAQLRVAAHFAPFRHLSYNSILNIE